MRLLLLLLMGANLFAQVGINTTNPSNAAALEISSNVNGSYGGLLPPKVTLAQRNAIPVTASDDGLLILLVNGTQRCIQVYDGINGMWQDIFCMNLVPVASSLAISGTTTDGQPLTGSFTYSDPESNPPGTHQYKWYRADNSSGLNAVEIAGATSASYTLTPADIGKNIAFEVTPVALAGASPGVAVRSAYTAAISAKPTIISFVQLTQSVNENASPNTITLRFSYPNVSTSPVSVTVASSSYSRLTQTGPRTIVIPAGQPSPYNVVVFNVQNNSADDNTVASTQNSATGTANTWTPYTYNFTVSASLPNNGYFYLYLEGINPFGFQNCDEFAIDNVVVTGRNF